jgi:hypothetical protein
MTLTAPPGDGYAVFMDGGKAMTDLTNIVAGGRWAYWRIAMWGGAAVLLMLPAIAMQFHAEGVVWTASDFIAMGVMLGVACGACELVARASGNGAYRFAGGIAVATAFLTVWVNLAVGMIGSEDNPYNQLFGCVLLVALGGSVAARFRASGMAWAMGAAAVLQAGLGAIGMGSDHRGGVFSMIFALPWLVSALMFRKAAREEQGAPSRRG